MNTEPIPTIDFVVELQKRIPRLEILTGATRGYFLTPDQSYITYQLRGIRAQGDVGARSWQHPDIVALDHLNFLEKLIRDTNASIVIFRHLPEIYKAEETEGGYRVYTRMLMLGQMHDDVTFVEGHGFGLPAK